MPAVPLIDFDALDLGKVVATREDIRRVIMQRGRMELLDGIAHVDRENALVVAFVDVRGRKRTNASATPLCSGSTKWKDRRRDQTSRTSRTCCGSASVEPSRVGTRRSR